MASKKGRGRSRRPTYHHLTKKERQQIRQYSEFVPSLNKLRGKRKVTPSELGQLTKAKRRLKHTANLIPITEKQAKTLKRRGEGEIIAGQGIRAIRLRNVEPGARIRVKKSGVIVTSNGRDWEYHPIGDNPDDLIEFGVAQLEKGAIAVSLWTARGRVDDTQGRADRWAQYVQRFFQQYADADNFIVGVAVYVRDNPGHGKTQ